MSGSEPMNRMPIMDAIEAGDAPAVLLAIKGGTVLDQKYRVPDPNPEHTLDATPLAWAVCKYLNAANEQQRADSLKIVKILILAGADVQTLVTGTGTYAYNTSETCLGFNTDLCVIRLEKHQERRPLPELREVLTITGWSGSSLELAKLLVSNGAWRSGFVKRVTPQGWISGVAYMARDVLSNEWLAQVFLPLYLAGIDKLQATLDPHAKGTHTPFKPVPEDVQTLIAVGGYEGPLEQLQTLCEIDKARARAVVKLMAKMAEKMSTEAKDKEKAYILQEAGQPRPTMHP